MLDYVLYEELEALFKHRRSMLTQISDQSYSELLEL